MTLEFTNHVIFVPKFFWGLPFVSSWLKPCRRSPLYSSCCPLAKLIPKYNWPNFSIISCDLLPFSTVSQIRSTSYMIASHPIVTPSRCYTCYTRWRLYTLASMKQAEQTIYSHGIRSPSPKPKRHPCRQNTPQYNTHSWYWHKISWCRDQLFHHNGMLVMQSYEQAMVNYHTCQKYTTKTCRNISSNHLIFVVIKDNTSSWLADLYLHWIKPKLYSNCGKT